MPDCRILMVAGTRPEGVKLASLFAAMRRRTGLRAIFVATGQHPEMLHEALAEFGLAADIDLGLRNSAPASFCAALEDALPALLLSLKPDLILVQGDTNSAWVAALTAHALGLPVGHVEAGLRSGDPTTPWPEERNRREIDAVSALLFAPSDTAAANLRDAPGRVVVTGNTGIDAFVEALGGRRRRPGGVRNILVTCHRHETIPHLGALALVLRTLADRPDVRLRLPLHPNPKVRVMLQALLAGHPHIRLEEPQPYRRIVDWLLESDLLLTDSGGLQEEAPAIGLPTLVLREITERPEPIAAGNARLVGLEPARILSEATRLLDDADAYALMARPSFPYGHGDASERIVDAIEQWTAERRDQAALGFPPPQPSRKGAALERKDDGEELDAR